MADARPMTTPATPHEPTEPLHIRVAEPGELFAAIPALLGFAPQRSLVVLCFEADASTLGPIMRHDIVLTPDSMFAADAGEVAAEMYSVMANMASFCAREGYESAVALIVDDRATSSSRLLYAREFRALVLDLGDALASGGCHLMSAFVVDEIAHGAQWSSLLSEDHRGVTSDPRASKVAVARVLDGRPIHQSRADLENVLQPTDERLRRAVAQELSAVRDTPESDERTALQLVLSFVRRQNLDTLTPHDIAALGASISRVLVRDSVLALSIGDDADAAEHLWTVLTRHLPAPERSVPATLLAFSSYARGDGALASIALVSALEADPTYSLALLLDESLHAGASPELIRDVAESGYRCARLCGVELPRPTAPDHRPGSRAEGKGARARGERYDF